MIIDTGSSVTILASSIFEKINQQDQLKVRQFSEKLFLADGNELPVKGITKIPYQFENHTFQHDTVIADIESVGLIGLDFIKAKECEINYRLKTFVIKGHSFKFKEEQGQYSSCRIKAAKTVTIPPNTEFVVEGKIHKNNGLGYCSIAEPVRSILESHGLVPGRVLIDPSKGVVPICLANPSNAPIVLYKGTGLAVALPVSNVHALDDANVPVVNQVGRKSWDDDITIEKPDLGVLVYGPLPLHLQGLLDKSSKDFSEEQYIKSRNFLFQYAYVFSAGGNDIGRCDIINYRLDRSLYISGML